MKKIVLFLFFFLVFTKVYSQWSNANIGTSQDLYAVSYYSASQIWVGSYNQFAKTANGGASWSIVNPITAGGLPVTFANVYDLAVTGANSAVAVGFYNLGNNEYILNTTNGGTNWNIASNDNSAAAPRYMNAVDMNGARGVAVGNNGRIATSANSGSSWSFVNSGTSNYINDVKFASYDTVFAVGQSTILKSVNGGSSWTSTATTNTCQIVSCVQNVIYIGVQTSNLLLKSIDYGATYSTITLPFNSSGVLLALSRDTLLVASNNGLYVSKTGGATWEQFILTGNPVINMIDRYGANVMAVGNAGFAIKTGNINSCPTRPVSLFNIQGGATNYCYGDSITLNNTTANIAGYTYQWQVNNTTFDTHYNSGLKLNYNNQVTVSLIVSNANGSDTASTQIYVTGHNINPMVITSTLDSICKGNMVVLSLTNTQNGVTYRLRQGFTNIGTAQAGNGGTLSFANPSGINTTTTFNILAVKATSCFIDSAIQYKTISLYSNPTILTPACAPASNLCANHGIVNVKLNTINHNTDILVNNYFDYSCCQKTDLTLGTTYSMSVTVSTWEEQYVNVWLDLNNDGLFTGNEIILTGATTNHILTGNISLPVTYATVYNQYLRMRVQSDLTMNQYSLSACAYSTACGQTKDYAVQLHNAPSVPVPAFSTVATVGCTTSETFTNTSYNANTYTWDFGDGSAVSTALIPPAHVYSVSGTYTISLTACNGYGCATVTHPVTIVIPLVPVANACTPITFGGYAAPLMNIYFDTSYVNFGTGNYQNISNPSSGSKVCTNQIHVHAGTTYYITMVTNSTTMYRMGMWIDYNNSGTFDPNEYVNYFGSGYPVWSISNNSSSPIAVTIPQTTATNVPLRYRILVYDSGYDGFIYDGCGSGVHGYYLDLAMFITPAIRPTPLFKASSTSICSYNNITFTNTTQNATSYLWNFGDGTTSTAQNPVHAYSTAGTYSVKLVASNNTYSDSLTRTNYITIQQGLPIPLVTKNGTHLSTTAIANHYQWYVNNSLIAADTLSTVTAVLNNYYQVRVHNWGSTCTSPSAIFFNYPLTASFTCSPTSICTGATTTLTNGSLNIVNNAAFTVYWGDGNQDTQAGGGNFTHSYSAAGTYTVKMSGCNGATCDSMTRVNYITVTASPAVPVITLAGGQFSTTAIATSYQWYLNNVLIGGATSTTYTPTQQGTYKLKVTTGTCSTYSADFPYYPPTISFHSDTLSFCSSTASINFINTSTNATSYLWDFGDGTTSTSANPIHAYSSFGNYTVKLIGCDSIGCDSLTRTNYISLNAAPASPVVSYTSNQLSTLAVATNYQWYLNGVSINGANSSSYSLSQDGVYKLQITNNGCNASSADYSYYPVHVGFTGDTLSFCGTTTSTVNFTNTTTNVTSYTWDFGDGVTSSAVSPSHTYAGGGVYTVKLVACGTTNCDSITRINYINTNLAPATPLVSYSSNQLSTVAVATNYQWYLNGASINSANSSSYLLSQDGVYKLQITNNGCNASSSDYFYYPVHIGFTGDTLSFCGTTASTVNFTNTTTNANAYIWYFGDGVTSTTVNPSHTYAGGGVYTVKLVACGTTNCDSITRISYINTNLAPAPPVVTSTSNQLSTVAVASNYQWYFNGASINSANSPSYSLSQDGVYKLQITNNGCNASSADYSYYPVHIGFTGDTLSFCGTTASTVNFTNTTTNSTSYTWDFGDGVSSSAINPSHTYLNTGTFTVKLTACGTTNCDSSTQVNYITVNSAPIAPVINPAGTTLICSGGSAQLITSLVSGNNYQWYLNGAIISGAVDTTYSASLPGAYTVGVSNSFGCNILSVSATIAVDTNCVWPGDVDNNHSVDNFDLLPIGVYYSQTGNPRAIISNAWQAFPVADWGIAENPNTTDLKHADCNGDGIIDNNDTLAINLNFSLTHAIIPQNNNNRSLNSDIYFVTATNSFHAGDTVNAEIWLGTASAPVANVYGVAFNVTYPSSMVVPGSERLRYTSGLLGTPGTDAITISKIAPLANTAYGAITRINHTDVNGFGKIADFSFIINSTVSNPAVINLSFSNTSGDDATGAVLNFNPIADSVYVNQISTGIARSTASSSITIYPNPFTNQTTIYFRDEQKNTLVKLIDIVGNEVKTFVVDNANSAVIEKGEMKPGIYFIEITDQIHTTFNRKIVIQ